MFCILKEQALDLQFSSGRTVEAPIVFIFNVPVKCIQLFPQFWVGELLDVCQYPRFIASEILVKPIIDCREDQLVIVCESNPKGMIDEGSCSRIERVAVFTGVKATCFKFGHPRLAQLIA